MSAGHGTTVVVTHWVHPEVHARLRQFATVRAPTEPGRVWTREQVIAAAGDADALITSMADTVDAALLAACPRLRIVAATLKGYDNYDADACTHAGVWLSIVPDTIVAPTAELTVGLTLDLLRNIRRGDEIVRRGDFAGWRPQLYGATLRGASVGIVGMGRLGTAVAELLGPFGVGGLRHTDQDDTNRGGGSQRVELAELMATSDVVLALVPLTPSTHHLLGAGALARLRPGSYLVNVGRGSVVDEAAVLAALDDGRLAGYAADVFAMEDWALPDRPDRVPRRLREHPRTTFTPHLGSAVDAVRRDMSLAAADQVHQVLGGEPPRHAVNDPRA